jgi:hypothetical protein
MKRLAFITTIFLTALMISSAPVCGQAPSKKEKRAQEQSKAEVLRQVEEMRKQQEELKAQLEIEEVRNEQYSREYDFFYGGSTGPYATYVRGSDVNTSFTITNTLQNNTRKREYRFSVDTSCVNVNISVTVSCKKGYIVVTLYTPDGKKLNSLDFSDGESSVWRQSIRIKHASEKEKKKYTGEWLFRIETKEATGKYHISMTTS